MTYGEWLYKKRDALHIENGEWAVDIDAAPKRMEKAEATRYYGDKLKKAWEALGYGKRGRKNAQRVLPSRDFIERKIVEAFELGKKEGYKEACRKFATDEEVNAARIAAGTTR